MFRFANGSLADLAGRKVACFVHGYNVTAAEALSSARAYFERLGPALSREGQRLQDWVFLLFTWPGDTGTLYFNPAQAFAQASGVALFDLVRQAGAAHWSVAAHSLGAHVSLRAAAILGQRLYSGRTVPRMDRLLLLGASVEDDVFENPQRHEEYHFPESAFGVGRLHITVARSDEVLALPYLASEGDSALGYCGPQSLSPLQSLQRRVRDVIGAEFSFELHDLSPHSATIMNPALFVHNHGGYWSQPAQLDYYANLLV
ncbi:MAG: alpha/beta hydrolase [Aquabacterium sp.]